MLRVARYCKPSFNVQNKFSYKGDRLAKFLSTTDKTAEDAKQDGVTDADKSEKSDADTVASLQNEIKNLKDQVLRAYAEGENIRRIAQKDVENARSYANTSFAKAMLEIADDLERALSVVSPEQKKTLNDSNKVDKTLMTLVSGIEMSEKNLQKIFSRFGVARYGAVDDKFDPNIHDALFRIPDNDKPDTVGQIVKMGYKINDRVLRPAQVGARVKSE